MASRLDHGVLGYLRRLLGKAGSADCADHELLARFVCERDQAAFEALLARHGPLVLSVCRRVLGAAADAEDAFQATFVMLARKGASIRHGQALGAWLYRAATHIALDARRRADCRLLHERQAARMPAVNRETDAELHKVLDEEVAGLPAKYQAPVVLCYLQGKTHKQAARELGWPAGSLAKRLQAALGRLRSRLERRGLALSTAALATALASDAQAVPAALAAATLQSILTNQAAANVAALVKGATHAMFMNQLKGFAFAGLACLLVAASGVIVTYQAEAVPAPEPGKDEPIRSVPEVRDGLSLAIKAGQRTYRPAEKLELEMILTNVSDQELVVHVPGIWTGDFRTVLARDANQLEWQSAIWVPAEVIVTPITLKPGETMRVSFGATPWFHPSKEGTGSAVLPAGKYKMMVKLSWPEQGGQAVPPRVYAGAITSKPITIEIMPK